MTVTTIKFLYVSAQLIDDAAGKTLAAVTTVGTKRTGTMTEKVLLSVPKLLKAKKIKISAVVFDRRFG